MDRIFHHRVSLGDVSGIVLFAVAALAFFWQRQTAGVVLGAVLLVAAMLLVERTIHTTYTLTADGWLRIDRGRLSRAVAIRVGDIVAVRKIRLMGGLAHYLLIEYGAGKMISLQPDNEDRMKEEIEKRL